MGIQVIGGATGGGGGGGQSIILSITEDSQLNTNVDYEISIPAGGVRAFYYPFADYLPSLTLISFFDSNYNPLVSANLPTRDGGTNYPEAIGAVNLTSDAAYVSVKVQVKGFFVIEPLVSTANIYTGISAGTLTTLTTSNPSYVLAADSYIAVIGGGGGGQGGWQTGLSSIGGGSGYQAVGFKPAGTYAVTIGAGGTGGPTPVAQYNVSNGGQGGTSSFDDIIALGGNTNKAGAFAQGYGGSGGSSGASTSYMGAGGANGGSSPQNPNAGSNVPAAMWVPYANRPFIFNNGGLGGGVYAGGAGGAGSGNNNGIAAGVNTGGGGGGARSNSNTANTGGAGGSGVIYIWTPA